MKWITKGAIALLALLLMAPLVMAQEEHGEFGVFADYTRFHNLDNQNFWGAGARLGFNVNPWVQLEGDVAYDFARNFTTSTPGVTGTFQKTSFRILDGFFGPKIQSGAGPVKVFGTVKGGFANFQLTDKGVVSGVGNAIVNVPDGNTHFALYPGGGIELFAKWIGVRAEIGDMIYWENGSQHNLRFTIGPQFRW